MAAAWEFCRRRRSVASSAGKKSSTHNSSTVTSRGGAEGGEGGEQRQVAPTVGAFAQLQRYEERRVIPDADARRFGQAGQVGVRQQLDFEALQAWVPGELDGASELAGQV
ncbi:MAG: hypothetical protein ACR2MB_06875, partial [Acidimicrobiales bacterium]